jgi:hypothetical protein
MPALSLQFTSLLPRSTRRLKSRKRIQAKSRPTLSTNALMKVAPVVTMMMIFITRKTFRLSAPKNSTSGKPFLNLRKRREGRREKLRKESKKGLRL